MKAHKVVGIGEVLWDLLPAGPQLGGAPTNFAYHARALGADSSVISRIGNDPHTTVQTKWLGLTLRLECGA